MIKLYFYMFLKWKDLSANNIADAYLNAFYNYFSIFLVSIQIVTLR